MQNTTSFYRLLENKKTYLAKYQAEPDVKQIVSRFWELRHRITSPQNDIDWWIKRPFAELKSFVLNFNISNKDDRRQNEMNRKITDAGATMLGVIDGYEIWHIPNYESACLIGRNYKNAPTHWCISSDDPEYWYDNHDQSEFIFLVRQTLQHDEYDKVALEFTDGGRYFDMQSIDVWDLDDNLCHDRSVITEQLIHECWQLFKEHDCIRDDTMYTNNF